MGALDGEHVAAEAEVDVQVLEAEVVDVPAHVETRQAGGGQGAGVVVQVAGVVGVELVAAAAGVDGQDGVDVVQRAVDVDEVEGAGVGVGFHMPREAGRRGQGGGRVGRRPQARVAADAEGIAAAVGGDGGVGGDGAHRDQVVAFAQIRVHHDRIQRGIGRVAQVSLDQGELVVAVAQVDVQVLGVAEQDLARHAEDVAIVDRRGGGVDQHPVELTRLLDRIRRGVEGLLSAQEALGLIAEIQSVFAAVVGVRHPVAGLEHEHLLAAAVVLDCDTVGDDDLGAFHHGAARRNRDRVGVDVEAELGVVQQIAAELNRDEAADEVTVQVEGDAAIVIGVEEGEGLGDVLADGLLGVQQHVAVLVQRQVADGVHHRLAELERLVAEVKFRVVHVVDRRRLDDDLEGIVGQAHRRVGDGDGVRRHVDRKAAGRQVHDFGAAEHGDADLIGGGQLVVEGDRRALVVHQVVEVQSRGAGLHESGRREGHAGAVAVLVHHDVAVLVDEVEHALAAVVDDGLARQVQEQLAHLDVVAGLRCQVVGGGQHQDAVLVAVNVRDDVGDGVEGEARRVVVLRTRDVDLVAHRELVDLPVAGAAGDRVCAAVLREGERRVLGGAHRVEDQLALFVEGQFAAEVALEGAGDVHHRITGDVQHRVAGLVQHRVAERIQHRVAGEQVEHRLAALVEQRLEGEGIDDRLAAEVELGIRRVAVAVEGLAAVHQVIIGNLEHVDDAGHVAVVTRVGDIDGVGARERHRDVVDLHPGDLGHPVDPDERRRVNLGWRAERDLLVAAKAAGDIVGRTQEHAVCAEALVQRDDIGEGPSFRTLVARLDADGVEVEA